MAFQFTIQMAIEEATRFPIHIGAYNNGNPVQADCGVTVPGGVFTTIRPDHSDCQGCLTNDLTSVQA